MRALILVAGAALAVAACSSENAAENTMNVDENLAMETTDMNATMDMNADANMAMEAADDANAAADSANAAADTATAAANNAM